MFIKNERTMEDFIQADESFNKYIEDIYSIKNVKLLGRQVHIGDSNIIDLLYEGDGNAPYNAFFPRICKRLNRQWRW